VIDWCSRSIGAIFMWWLVLSAVAGDKCRGGLVSSLCGSRWKLPGCDPRWFCSSSLAWSPATFRWLSKKMKPVWYGCSFSPIRDQDIPISNQDKAIRILVWAESSQIQFIYHPVLHSSGYFAAGSVRFRLFCSRFRSVFVYFLRY
jgi:hypothetical protein